MRQLCWFKTGTSVQLLHTCLQRRRRFVVVVVVSFCTTCKITESSLSQRFVPCSYNFILISVPFCFSPTAMFMILKRLNFPPLLDYSVQNKIKCLYLLWCVLVSLWGRNTVH